MYAEPDKVAPARSRTHVIRGITQNVLYFLPFIGKNVLRKHTSISLMNNWTDFGWEIFVQSVKIVILVGTLLLLASALYVCMYNYYVTYQ